MTEDSKSLIKKLLKSNGGSNGGSEIQMEEFSHDEANTVLLLASGPEVQAVVRETAKSVSQLPQPSKTSVFLSH